MKEQFKILTARDHARLRIGVYMGSTALEPQEQFVLGKWTKALCTPAIMKMINEIIDNSVDELIRSKYTAATKIDVTFREDGFVTITDNGRGIPHDYVEDTTGEQILRPVAAWTKTNAGTSFDDDRVSNGANGLGSSVSNFLSDEFIGETWRDGKIVRVHCLNGAETINVETGKKSGPSGTQVSFKPDYSLFQGTTNFRDDDTIVLIKDRLSSLAVLFPECQFSLNGEKIASRNLKSYSDMFAEEGDSVLLFEKQGSDLRFFITGSSDGFRASGYTNGVHNRLGGTYIDFVSNGILDELLPMIKKKYKFEITKSVAKNNLAIVLFARNFVNPRFDSQTKERLTNSVAEVKVHYSQNEVKSFQDIAKKIISTPDLIDPMIAAQLAKKEADDLREAAKNQRKIKKIKVAKHVAASDKNAMLVLAEGDSAISTGISVRDPAKIGLYPLRGVVMNVWNCTASEVLKNKVYEELIAILGINITDPKSYKDNMFYGSIGIMVDADPDGSGHIGPLLVGFFKKFWPGMIEDGLIKLIKSPIMISTKGKETKWFYELDEASEFKKTTSGWNHRYIKGLGSLEKDEFAKALNTPYLQVVTEDDMTPNEIKDICEIMFGDDAAIRKPFMMA